MSINIFKKKMSSMLTNIYVHVTTTPQIFFSPESFLHTFAFHLPTPTPYNHWFGFNQHGLVLAVRELEINN